MTCDSIFSQNSMFAAYVGFCFPTKIAGIWQVDATC